MTYREVQAAADGRLRAEWMQTASMMAWVAAKLTGEEIEPQDLMPTRYRPPVPKPPEKTPELIAHEGRMAWLLLDSYFQQR